MLLFFCFAFLSITPTLSQDYQKLRAYFVKPEIHENAGSIMFNVVRVINPSTDAIPIRPIINIPDGWAMFGAAFRDTLVGAKDTISLPFRLKIPTHANGNISHKVNFKALSRNGKLLAESDLSIELEAVHNWNVLIPEKRIIFQPNLQFVRFDVVVSNRGNTPETIQLDIEPGNKIKLEQVGIIDDYNEITLEPNRDTILEFKAFFKSDDDRVFDIGKVRITASSGDQVLHRSVILEKYSDTYAPLEFDRNLPHETEAGVRTFSHNDEVLPFIKARGFVDISNESSFKYNFNYYDITANENFVSNSYYSFLYRRRDLRVGLGAFSSQLGRNLYNRSSIMVADKIELNKSSSIEAYASTSLLSPNTSAALGYHLQKDNRDIKASLAYNMDEGRKRNTASAIVQLGRLPLFNNHEVGGVLYAFHEHHYRDKKYNLMGVAYDLNFFGKLGDKLSYQLTNNYGSPDIPGRQMGLLNFYAKARYFIDKKNYVSANYINSKRDYYNMTYEGVRKSNILLKDQYANVLYHDNRGKFYRWFAGPSIEYYRSYRPGSEETGIDIYKVNKYRMEYKALFGRHLMLNLKTGIGHIFHEDTDSIAERKFDIHALASWDIHGYGIQLAYDYGPVVNKGLYQFAIDAGNSRINVSPYAIKELFNDRIYLTFFTNYTYRFDLEYGSLNINPKVETYLFRDWYFVAGGTYSYTTQEFNGKKTHNTFYYAEFSLKKKWGKSDAKSRSKQLRKVRIQLFRDENGNGKKDSGEKGIRSVKVGLRLKEPVEAEARKLPFDVSLLTNDKGVVRFNKVPMGQYDITITPLADLKEYFFVGKDIETLEIIGRATYEIPFQKASKIEGRIDLKRQKFVTETDQRIKLDNIRITAYNKKGNSYSAFTGKEGGFTIYVPGNNSYNVRMQNVFGNKFRIMNNDIHAQVYDSISDSTIFRIVERSRKVKFKKAKPAGEKEDLQKFKVLSGEVYEKTGESPPDKNSIPEFNIDTFDYSDKQMEDGKYYVLLDTTSNKRAAVKLIRIFHEQGVRSYLGYDASSSVMYIFTNHYNTRGEARTELKRLEEKGLRSGEIFRYEAE